MQKQISKLIQQIRWHPNQSWIGVAQDSDLIVYDEHLETIYTFSNHGLACICSFDFDWDHVVVCYYMGDIWKWCISSGQLVSKISTLHKCSTILIVQDQYFVGTDHGAVFSHTNNVLFTMRDRVTCMSLVENKKWVVGCYDGHIGICQHALLIKIIQVDFNIFSIAAVGLDLIVGGKSLRFGWTTSIDHEWNIQSEKRSLSWFAPNNVLAISDRLFMATDAGYLYEVDPMTGILSQFQKQESRPIRCFLVSADLMYFYYSCESQIKKRFRFPQLRALPHPFFPLFKKIICKL